MGRKPLTFRPNRRDSEETASTQPKEEEAGAKSSTKGRKKQRASRPKEEESREEKMRNLEIPNDRNRKERIKIKQSPVKYLKSKT